jgi:hypothetical protein
MLWSEYGHVQIMGAKALAALCEHGTYLSRIDGDVVADPLQVKFELKFAREEQSIGSRRC